MAFSTSAFYNADPSTIGMQPFAETSTTQRHGLGHIVRGKSANYGYGEFIYLLGVANTVVGSVVSYNATTWQTTLLPNTANLNTPIAVAMSANVASQYGWYQIGGLAIVKKTAVPVTPQVAVYISGTAGRIKSTAASGKQIVNAKTANLTTVASGTSTVTVLLQRPHAQGAVS